MPNALAIVRSLIIYGLCLPLAILLGYLLAMPMDLTNFVVVLLAVLLPLVPVLLRWHHFLLVLSWNISAVLFFLPGRPNLWIVMAAVSLLLSILQRAMSRDAPLLSVPSVSRPLIFLLLVIAATAALTGGIGIRSLGGEEYGGKRYVMLAAAIVGYFAISCQRPPPGRELLYVSAFLLAGICWVIGALPSLIGYVHPNLYFIFAIFPVESLAPFMGEGAEDISVRLGGFSSAGMALIWYGLARYGLRGLFQLGGDFHFLPFRFRGGFQVNQPWRLIMVLLAIWMTLQGGFRSALIFLLIMLVCHFFFEGLHRSRALPLTILLGILAAAITLPLMPKLPLSVQRSFSFLPVEIDPAVRLGADSSTEWRLRMWRAILPTVPQYLLLGKGYAINPSELAKSQMRLHQDDAETAMIAGDYHNGPLTLLIPLGIWGAIGFLWFLGAGFRVLLRNYRYGDPALRHANIFMLLFFCVHAVFYFFVFGSFYTDLPIFTGVVALNISVNGGVRGPAPAVAAQAAFHQFRLARTAR
jgi:hypothetical protein